MKMIDLIEQYKKRLENNPNDYTYLLFALQIPSICSRIEFPQTPENTGRCEDGKLYKVNGNPWDANMYKAWLMKHSNSFVDIYYSSMELNVFCKTVYDLRCQTTHEGVLMTNESHFYFTNSDNAMCIGDVVFLPMKRLCEDMFDTATINIPKFVIIKRKLTNHFGTIIQTMITCLIAYMTILFLISLI